MMQAPTAPTKGPGMHQKILASNDLNRSSFIQPVVDVSRSQVNMAKHIDTNKQLRMVTPT